jgi:hypothetical protein
MAAIISKAEAKLNSGSSIGKELPIFLFRFVLKQKQVTCRGICALIGYAIGRRKRKKIHWFRGFKPNFSFIPAF